MTEYMKNFIEENINLIDSKKFTLLYDKLSIDTIPEFTQVLLTSNIEFLSYISSIPSQCFAELPIENITIPENIDTIESYAFHRCNSLQEVRIEGSIALGTRAFELCTNLRKVTFNGTLSDYTDTNSRYQFRGCTNLTDIMLPEGLKKISNGMFQSCKSLQHMSIPHSVTEIGRYAFDSCTNLKSIELPAVEILREHCFQECSNLTDVHLGSSIQYIDFGVFSDNYDVLNIKYDGTTDEWSSVQRSSHWRSNVQEIYIECSNDTIRYGRSMVN